MTTDVTPLVLPDYVRFASTAIFAIAIVHTFCVKMFAELAHRAPEGSIRENFFHLLSEVEIVFGFWAGVFVLFLAASLTPKDAIDYVESRNYTEPLFVFVIMTVSATRPVLGLVGRLMEFLAKGLVVAGRALRLRFFSRDMSEFLIIFMIGPILGSFITEPAAMTVSALLLLRKFYSRTSDLGFKYAMTGLLFVNISIGGTLTSFAAPPVLMVATTWSWNTAFMMQHFGWKAVIAVVVSTSLVALRYRKSISDLRLAVSTEDSENAKAKPQSPLWLSVLHLIFVAGIVFTAHYPAVFMGLFLFFIGVTVVTKEFQSELKVNEGLLVGFFLAGLVVLGGPQGWWLEPVLAKLSSFPLFAGATALTALTDNAALTYLGSLVPDLSDASKYALVAGAVTGGGLTVIANAPNPAGYGILNRSFGETGLSPLQLFKAALIPTLIAALCFWFL